MGYQQQQSGTGSLQDSPQKTAKNQDMSKKKSGAKSSADDAPDADDEMAADRMDSEGHVAGTSSFKKGKKDDDAGQVI